MTDNPNETILEYAPKEPALKGSAEKKPRGHKLKVTTYTLIVLAGLVASGIFFYPVPPRPVHPGKADPSLTDVISTGAPGSRPEIHPEPPALHDEDAARRIDTLEREMGNLRSQTEREHALARDRILSPAMLAILNLRDRVTHAMPYEADLAVLQSLSASDPELSSAAKELAEHLHEGVTSMSALREEFASLEDDIIAAARPEDAGFLARLQYSARHLVRVRKLGEEPKGEDAEALVWKVEIHLERGALAQALEAFGTLPDPARKTAEHWEKQAAQVLAVEKTFAAMVSRVTVLASELPHPEGATAPGTQDKASPETPSPVIAP